MPPRSPASTHIAVRSGAPATIDPSRGVNLFAPVVIGVSLFRSGRGDAALLMDTAGGIGEPQEWALARADQAVVLCPPDYMAANNIATVLTDPDLRLPERTTLVLNDTRPEGGGDLAAIERHFARHSFEARIRVPYDHTLRLTLDQATYRLHALPRSTRLALKRLAATIGEGLR